MKAMQFLTAALGLGSQFINTASFDLPRVKTSRAYPIYSKRECARRVRQMARDASRQAARQARHAAWGAA